MTQQFHFLVSTLDERVQVHEDIQRYLHVALFAIREDIGMPRLNNPKFMHALDYSAVPKLHGL